jgi:N-acetylmuramoyl-L-alanine amidase
MRTLFVDTGHSARFPGATGEAERNGKLADVFCQYAQRIGWKIVRVPREFAGDRTSNGNLISRIKWINDRCLDGDWLISIHHNASTSTQARGVEVCYMGGSEYMRKMAASLATRVAEESNMKIRGTGAFDDRKGRFGKIGMVRDTKPPALLIEAGFITNGKDRAVPLAVVGKAMAEWFEDLASGVRKDLKI